MGAFLFKNNVDTKKKDGKESSTIAVFELPEKFSGRSLNQIFKELEKSGQPFPSAALAQDIGVGFDQPLQTGQAFSFKDDPGSAGFQFLQSQFSPAGTFQTQQATELATSQKAEETSFLDALREKIGGQEKIGAAAERIGGELQLPALRQSSFDLLQTLEGVRGRQLGQAQKFGISASNLERRISAETGRLAPAAQKSISQQQFGEAELGRRLGFLLAEQEKELSVDFGPGFNLLNSRLARENSNFQLEQQQELSVLLTNMAQAGVASQNELNRIQELALRESDFQKQVDFLRLQTDEGIRSSTALKGLDSSGDTSNLGQFFGPQISPATGAGTVQGNWYFTGTEWIPIR